MCVKHNALILCGSAKDIKNGICEWMEKSKKSPKIIILDYPKDNDCDYISYGGIEEIKNGCFFSPKFKGGMCFYNTPNVVILANQPPDTSRMFKDRFITTEIN